MFVSFKSMIHLSQSHVTSKTRTGSQKKNMLTFKGLISHPILRMITVIKSRLDFILVHVLLLNIMSNYRINFAGFMTGNCIDSLRYKGTKACEVRAWCPTEDGSLKPYIFFLTFLIIFCVLLTH